GKLSFGLKAGGHLLNINLQELNKYNTGDPLFGTDIDNKFSPNVGLGVYYHTDRFYLGVSTPNLLETEHFDESNISSDSEGVSFLAKERINYYIIAGHTFDLSDDLKFKPAVLSKVVFGAPLQVDVSASFLLYERVTLGAAYRWSAAVSGMVGFQISDSMMLGFAYDKETTELGNTQFNDGSYEVFLRFELFRKYNRMLTPRFF
ncbi:type IX secretion system membrane protein PorP/SprF, partial [Aquimarina sp. 2-A2]|uniref:PorP/SprF family type IX secretion system membrane protein n=1 Tax=Aquimarina sp. 2-A2 TaxID=3382644 RepID=UPI00387F0905